MNCEHYQQLLHLSRPGELSAAEAKKLSEHLAACERCSLELQQIQRSDRLIEQIRRYAPEPEHSGLLTAGVLRRLQSVPASKSSGSVFNHLLDSFSLRPVRYASLGFVVTVVSFFVIQSLLLFRQISDLEGAISAPKTARRETAVTARSETLGGIADREGLAVLAAAAPISISGNRVRIPAQTLDYVLSSASFERLGATVGSSALRLDRKTMEKIIKEIRTTAERTLFNGRQGESL